MVALIGPPPSEFVKRSETTEQCFDPSGKRAASSVGSRTDCNSDADAFAGAWIAHKDAVVPPISLRFDVAHNVGASIPLEMVCSSSSLLILFSIMYFVPLLHDL